MITKIMCIVYPSKRLVINIDIHTTVFCLSPSSLQTQMTAKIQ